jgi:hypothetical protein
MTVAPNHHEARLLGLATVAIYLAASTPALPQAGSTDEFESCKVIAADQARLDCFKRLLSKNKSGDTAGDDPASKDPWPLIKTPRPNGAGEAFAIMRAGDTAESDTDFAGLMIRCREQPGLEVVLALMRPLPPRSKRDVVILPNAGQLVLHAETAPPGTALVLPIDGAAFTTGDWRELKQLSIKVIDPDGDIKGVVPLDGVGPAIAKLSVACQSRQAK